MTLEVNLVRTVFLSEVYLLLLRQSLARLSRHTHTHTHTPKCNEPTKI